MRGRVTLFVCCLAALALMPFVGASDAQDSAELRPPSAFAGMSDQQARSRALFTEAAKVIMNPRCMNCHPASDRPTQGNDMHPHLPQVTRGADGGGVPGNTCGACHMDRSVPIFAGQQTTFQSMPGHPRWGLAPIEMAWEGKSAGEICRQIKDPQRNGGRGVPPSPLAVHRLAPPSHSPPDTPGRGTLIASRQGRHIPYVQGRGSPTPKDAGGPSSRGGPTSVDFC